MNISSTRAVTRPQTLSRTPSPPTVMAPGTLDQVSLSEPSERPPNSRVGMAVGAVIGGLEGLRGSDWRIGRPGGLRGSDWRNSATRTRGSADRGDCAGRTGGIPRLEPADRPTGGIARVGPAELRDSNPGIGRPEGLRGSDWRNSATRTRGSADRGDCAGRTEI
jgi:hypothetical protein